MTTGPGCRSRFLNSSDLTSLLRGEGQRYQNRWTAGGNRGSGQHKDRQAEGKQEEDGGGHEVNKMPGYVQEFSQAGVQVKSGFELKTKSCQKY